METNYFAAVAGTLAVLPGMLERHHGVVVNVSSDSGRAPSPHEAAYSASKAALSAFTESLSFDTEGKGVHLHVLYPGWVPTAMGSGAVDDGMPMPPRMVRRTEEQVSRLVLARMGGAQARHRRRAHRPAGAGGTGLVPRRLSQGRAQGERLSLASSGPAPGPGQTTRLHPGHRDGPTTEHDRDLRCAACARCRRAPRPAPHELVATEPLAPVPRQGAVGRAGHGVFGDAAVGGEHATHAVDPGTVAGGGDDDPARPAARPRRRGPGAGPGRCRRRPPPPPGRRDPGRRRARSARRRRSRRRGRARRRATVAPVPAWWDRRGSPSRSNRRPPGSTRGSPLLVWKVPAPPSTWAEANVAWPHRSISTVGVNQRRSCSPSGRGTTKAVSDRFISRAMACIRPSSGKASRTVTAAGLPAKGRSVKESTTVRSMDHDTPRRGPAPTWRRRPGGPGAGSDGALDCHDDHRQVPRPRRGGMVHHRRRRPGPARQPVSHLRHLRLSRPDLLLWQPRVRGHRVRRGALEPAGQGVVLHRRPLHTPGCPMWRPIPMCRSASRRWSWPRRRWWSWVRWSPGVTVDDLARGHRGRAGAGCALRGRRPRVPGVEMAAGDGRIGGGAGA